MKVAKERPLCSFATGQTVQLRKKGIRQITGFRGTGRATKDRRCRRVQVSAIGAKKMFPGSLVPIDAGGGQSQVLQMQCAQIVLEFLRSERSRCQGLLRATLERGGESFPKNLPTAGRRLGVETIPQKRPGPRKNRGNHPRTTEARDIPALHHYIVRR